MQRPRHDTETSSLGPALKGSMNNLTHNIIFPLAEMYTEGLVCFKYCAWLLLPSAFGFGIPVLWQAVASVMWGRRVGCVCRTDTQPESCLLDSHFTGTLQYETCHLSSPPKQSKLWLKRFRGASRPAACQPFVPPTGQRSQAAFHARGQP